MFDWGVDFSIVYGWLIYGVLTDPPGLPDFFNRDKLLTHVGKKISRRIGMLWTHLGSNQGPSDYEYGLEISQLGWKMMYG